MKPSNPILLGVGLGLVAVLAAVVVVAWRLGVL